MRKRKRARISVYLAMSAGVFIAELVTPLGYVIWILLLIPIVLIAPLVSSRTYLLILIIGTLSIIAEFFFVPPSDVPANVIVFNRGIGIVVIWVVGILSLMRQKLLNRVTENEKELRKLNAELVSTNNDLESFSYSVSHDLRNPLQIILATNEWLSRDTGVSLDPESRAALDQSMRSAERMSRIIDDLLALSRISRREMRYETVDLGEIARKVIEGLMASAPEREVDFSVGDGLIARADPGFARILLENLLGNAWKFTSKRDRARIEFGAVTGGGAVSFFIRDNGAGFDMRRAETLFQPFHRLHSEKEFKGTGIGLAIVKRIVDRHGGAVWAEGEPGRGATVYFRLA